MTNMPTHAIPKYMTLIIIGVIIVGVMNSAILGLAWYYAAQQPTVEIIDFMSPVDADLCPGDVLGYRFTIKVSKAATVDVGTTIRPDVSVRPSYSRLQQFIFNDATEFVLVRHFVIPPTFTDPATGTEIPWEPGKYVQRTIVNIEGKSTGADVLEVPFVLRSDCS